MAAAVKFLQVPQFAGGLVMLLFLALVQFAGGLVMLQCLALVQCISRAIN